MDDLYFKLGPIPVKIHSNDSDFLAYAGSHFKPQVLSEPQSPLVEVSFVRDARQEDEKSVLSRSDKIGRGIYKNQENVVWSSVPFFPGLTVSFSFARECLIVDAEYSQDRTMKRRLKTLAASLTAGAGHRNSFYFELLYQLVYYPAFWVLMGSGISILHGGGVQTAGKGIVMAGAQGTGKSTLLATLLAESGSKFISDNILFFDEKTVSPCHEPVRIDEKLLIEVPGLRDNIEKIELDVPLGRSAFNVRDEVCAESMTPDIFLIPRMSLSETNLVPASMESVLSRIICFNKLADEVRSFEVFSAVLRQKFPSDRPYGWDTVTLRNLLDGKGLYDLNIKYGEHPRETARKLLETVSG